MLNIISRSIYNKKVRGPKKVVDNLILGLKKMGYPYVINKDLNSCKRLWIHDDIEALKRLKDVRKDIAVIIGPNLFVNPENIPKNLDLSRTVYVQPSLMVKNVWENRKYDKSKIQVWPVGIDTEKYSPSNKDKDLVLVYFKNRKKEELEFIENSLKSRNINYKTIIYGSYNNEDYLNLLKATKYVIWLGGYESQGIALEEALSCNIPMLVLDKKYEKGILDENSTSIPYFDDRCGIVLKDIANMDKSLDIMEKEYRKFSPRDFILENLDAEKQARKFLDLYEKYFNLKTQDGFKEKCYNSKDFKVSTVKRLYNKIYGRLFNRQNI